MIIIICRIVSYQPDFSAKNDKEMFRNSHRICSVEKGVFKNFANFTRKHLCQSLFFNKVASKRLQLYLKEALAQVFSCEYRETFKSTYFPEQIRTTASKRS